MPVQLKTEGPIIDVPREDQDATDLKLLTNPSKTLTINDEKDRYFVARSSVHCVVLLREYFLVRDLPKMKDIEGITLYSYYY